MLRYFVAGNLWIFFAIVLRLGQKAWRSEPTFYSFFGFGSLNPAEYNLLIVFCVAEAAIFFMLAFRTAKNS